MAIKVNLDLMMVKRGISLTELSEKVGITLANLSILKSPTVLRQHDGGRCADGGDVRARGHCFVQRLLHAGVPVKVGLCDGATAPFRLERAHAALRGCATSEDSRAS